MMKFLGKKMTMTIIGAVVVLVTLGICQKLGFDQELTNKVVAFVAGFFGLSIAGHVASDVSSIIKGIQVKEEKK